MSEEQEHINQCVISFQSRPVAITDNIHISVRLARPQLCRRCHLTKHDVVVNYKADQLRGPGRADTAEALLTVFLDYAHKNVYIICNSKA